MYCHIKRFILQSITIISIILISVLDCYSQEKEEQKAINDFQIIESENRYTDNLKDIEGKSYNLPIGFKKIAKNFPVTVAISNVKIGSQFAEASMYAKIEIPAKSSDKKSRSLIFGAQGVKISYNGDIVGDVKLMLLSSHPIQYLYNITK